MNETLKLSDYLQGGAPTELKLASAGTGKVAGYGSTFGGEPDAYGDIIAPGAFAKSLARHASEGTMPAMLWAHDPGEVIGAWTVAREDEKGLWLEGSLNLETQRGREALALAKQGAATGLSIGFRVLPGGRKFDSAGVRTLTDLDLVEVSGTAIPANRSARLVSVKSVGSAREFETFLKDNGFANAAARKLAAGGWGALNNTQDEDTVAALIQQVKAAAADLKQRTT